MSIRELYAKELRPVEAESRRSTSAETLAEEILRQAFRSVETSGLSSGAAGRYRHLDSADNAAPTIEDKQTQVEAADEDSRLHDLPRASHVDTRDVEVLAAPALIDALAQTDLVGTVSEQVSSEQQR